MSSIYEEMSSEQKKKAKKLMGQLTQNPIAKSSGAGALSPEAAEQLGDKAKQLRKKKLSQIGLPSIKNKELEEAHYNPVTKKIQDKPASREEIESLAAKARTKKKVRKPLGSIRKNSATFTPSSPEQAKADKASWNAYWEGSWKNKEQKEEYVSEAKGMSKDEMSSILKGHKYSKKELLDMSKKSTKEGRHGEAAAFYQEFEKEEYIAEREMSSTETKKEKKLKKKYDTSGMKKSMIDQYGKEKGTQIYFATIRKQAMEDSFEPDGEQLDEIAPLVAAGLAAGGAALGAMALNKAKNKVNSAIDGARKTSPIGGDRYSKQLQQLRQSFDYDDAYAYIIEMLVAADYAEDYEAAEVMFEHISDEFTSVILEEYIEEKARGTRKKTTVHAYDVDETLFGHGKKGKPNVQVHVNDASGKRVKSLSNQEFNTHKLDKGHSYDFSEFQSAKKFSQTASPNKKVIKDIKRKQARGQNVHLITARSKFDNPSEFQGHLKKHGVDVEKSNIHYTGGMRGGDIGKKKVDVANAVAKKSGAKSIHMYDDAAKVHKAFEAEKKEKPKSKKIKTHMVAPDKSGESRVRSYQATKNEEMTSYEYWKQFINEASDPKKDVGARMGNAITNTLKDVATGTGKDIVNLATTGKFKDTPERQRLRQGVSNFTASSQNALNKLGGYPTTKPTSAKTKPATAKPKSMTADSGRGGDAAFRAGGGNAALKPGMNRQQVQAAGMSALRAKPKVGNIPSQEGTGKAGPSDTKPSKVIDAKNIAGKQQKVSTNKAYDAKLGGFKASATYGDKGQRMIRANLGNAGVNQVKAGKAKVGQSYGATLGGVKGNVKYDAKGNRSFQALQKPAAPAKPSKPVK